MNKIKEKTNKEPEHEMEGVINGNHTFERLMNPFHICAKLNIIFNEMAPLTYETHSDVEMEIENLKANEIPKHFRSDA